MLLDKYCKKDKLETRFIMQYETETDYISSVYLRGLNPELRQYATRLPGPCSLTVVYKIPNHSTWQVKISPVLSGNANTPTIKKSMFVEQASVTSPMLSCY